MPNQPEKAIIKYRKITTNKKQLLPNSTVFSNFNESREQSELNITLDKEKYAIRQYRNLEQNLGDKRSLRMQTHVIQYRNGNNSGDKYQVALGNSISDMNTERSNASKLNSLEKSLISKNKRNQRRKQNPFKDRQKDIKAKFNILSEKKKLNRLASDKVDTPNKYDSGHNSKNKKINLHNSSDLLKINIAVMLNKHNQIAQKKTIFKGVQGKQLKISHTINYNQCCNYFEKEFMTEPLFEQSQEDRLGNDIVSTQQVFINHKTVQNRKSFRTMMDDFGTRENYMKNRSYMTVGKDPSSKNSCQINSEKHRHKTAQKFSPWETETNNNEQQFLWCKYRL